MKDKLFKMASAIALMCPLLAYSQESPRSFEFGLGGSAVNHTRVMLSDFHQTQGGDYVFTLEEKLLYGGTNLYWAVEIRPWIYADVQGTFGFARYYDHGNTKNGWSVMAGPGIQLRPPVGSGWVQPYLRVGFCYYHKDFPACYFGPFEGDPTNEAVWKAEDSWNKGYTFDTDSFVPFTAGIGVVGWISNRVGLRLEADYLRSLGSKGANFAMGSAGMVFRIGGREKPSGTRVEERIVEKVVEKEIIKEVPVETIREVVREIPVEKAVALLMDNVTFDFDKAEITP
ncbi:MAG: OmpA family protein, partial [Bacteroidales bacterium]|nr:OmpA family protein [Bacteroidales bacterium]